MHAWKTSRSREVKKLDAIKQKSPTLAFRISRCKMPMDTRAWIRNARATRQLGIIEKRLSRV